METRKITDGVYLLAAIDWNRRLFDALIPLPDGTSYNAYLIEGGEKTALLDAVDPSMAGDLLAALAGVKKIDYIVAHHAEQDHSGSIPQVLAKFPEARVVCTAKCKEMLIDHLGLAPEVFDLAPDGGKLDLGGKTLEFLHTPWVHWPETMCTYLAEDRILFSCDFFGSHLATNDIYVTDEARVLEAAKRYFAEIMLPFRKPILKDIEKVSARDFGVIAPSHGPLYDKPKLIIDAWREWTAETEKGAALVVYVSMHGSTLAMAERLAASLAKAGVETRVFDMATADVGKLAMALIGASTLVIGTPTVNNGPHPAALYAAQLISMLKPALKYGAVFGSFGWSTRTGDQMAEVLSGLKLEMLPPILVKGAPCDAEFAALDALAAAIAEKSLPVSA